MSERDGTELEQGGSDDASRQSKQSARWAVAYPAVPRPVGMSTKKARPAGVSSPASAGLSDGTLPFAIFHRV